MANFAIIGVGGYIAPKHLQAIKDTGNTLVAALDLNDSVGILDNYFPNCKFFTETERFDRHLEKLKRKGGGKEVHYVSICSPNYLHDAHIKLALRIGANVICEKPLVISPWNLNALIELEKETGKKIYSVLQLRVHPQLIKLKKKIEKNPEKKYEVNLNYITRRGPWYHVSWKGNEEKSGGIIMNIGVHFFDLLIWLFGKSKAIEVFQRETKKQSGFVELENAHINWFLSVDENDLPNECKMKKQNAFRSIVINGEEIEFSGGFNNLHTRIYEDALNGIGFGIEDSRASIELVNTIRNLDLSKKHKNITLQKIS